VRSSDLPAARPAQRWPAAVPLAEIRRAIDELLALAQTFGDQRSAFGGQLDAIQQGTAGGGDEHLWRRARVAEERHARYATLLVVWNRLRPLEQRVLMAQRTPCGSTVRVVQVRIGDLVGWTRHGAEVIGRTRKFDGRTVVADDECIFVTEPVPVYPTRDKVARQLGVSVDQVRRATSAAYDVWRAFLAAGE
jgi:hypothetical protein